MKNLSNNELSYLFNFFDRTTLLNVSICCKNFYNQNFSLKLEKIFNLSKQTLTELNIYTNKETVKILFQQLIRLKKLADIEHKKSKGNSPFVFLKNFLKKPNQPLLIACILDDLVLFQEHFTNNLAIKCLYMSAISNSNTIAKKLISIYEVEPDELTLRFAAAAGNQVLVELITQSVTPTILTLNYAKQSGNINLANWLQTKFELSEAKSKLYLHNNNL